MSFVKNVWIRFREEISDVVTYVQMDRVNARVWGSSYGGVYSKVADVIDGQMCDRLIGVLNEKSERTN